MRKLLTIICILLSFLLINPLSSQAQEDGAIVFVTFDKVNYSAQEHIALTIHVKDFTNLYGFQVDLEETYDDFLFANPIDPFEMSSNSIFYGDHIFVNGEADDVQSIMVTRQESESTGYDFSSKTALATIFLVAVRDIENPYDLVNVSNDFDDLLYGDANLVIKLSDPSGLPISYQYKIVLPDPIITLNPGVDTIEVGKSHIDSGVNVEYQGYYDVQIENGVDSNSVGSYQIIYHVSFQDQIVDVIRYVYVISKQKEVRFDLNTALTTIKVGDTFEDPGCNVYVDDVLYSPCMVVINNVNTTIKGIYTIEYTITVNQITYKMKRYIFVIDNDFNLDMPYKKEEEMML